MELPKDGNLAAWIVENLAEHSMALIDEAKWLWADTDIRRTLLGQPTNIPFELGLVQLNMKDGREVFAYHLVWKFAQEDYGFFLIVNAENKIIKIVKQGDGLEEGPSATLN